MNNHEGTGSIIPLIFKGSNLVYWKIRTKAYVQSLGVDVWEIVEGGYQFPAVIPMDTTCKKLYETNAKVVNTLLGSLLESKFVKVMQLKTTKEIKGKIIQSYEGDSQNLGEEIKEATLVEKILRSLSSKFESKVSSIEEKQDLQSITVVQLHGILTTFEMRKGGPSDMREAAFKASAKGKEKEEHNESGYI
eukprot:PITA_28711